MKAEFDQLIESTQDLVQMFRECHQEEIETDHHGDGPSCSYCLAIRRAERAIKTARKEIAARPITVHVRGGVAYCDSPSVRIIDHDNR